MNDTCTINVHAVSGLPTVTENISAMKLRVEIDGTVHEAKWGDSTYTVTPGPHEIKIYYWHWLQKNQAIRSTTVTAEPGSPCAVRYALQPGLKGKVVLEVNGEPDPEGGASQTDSQLKSINLLITLVLPGIMVWLLSMVDWPLWLELTLLAVSISFVIIYVVVNRRRSQSDHSG